MNRNRLLTLSLALCLLAMIPGLAQATSGWRNDWRTYYDPCQPLYDANCTVCHTSVPSFNSYGQQLFDFADGGMTREEAFAAAEPLDADGDGYTTAQEIWVDCTLPGDASEHGTVGVDLSSWDNIKALYQ